MSNMPKYEKWFIYTMLVILHFMFWNNLSFMMGVLTVVGTYIAIQGTMRFSTQKPYIRELSE